ncbi:MAG: cation diffusion facilitator family transporter [Bacilli bacterium]|nr:cation diffusion facilitator family transporter [Bacilli bacterium]
MVTLLRRLFIKNYKNVSDKSVRIAHGKFAAWFGITTNLILAAGKLTVAVLLASRNSWILPMALVADAANNFSDMGSSLVTLIGFKMSGKPADKEHPFGHQRIEYIAGLIVSVLVIAVAITLFKDSLTKVIDGSTTSYDLLTLIILGASILLKLFQGYVNRGIGKAIDSVSLMATALDSLMDVIATTAILISGILAMTVGWNFLDGYMGIAVSIFVAYSGIKALKETADPLIGQKGDENFVNGVVEFIKENDRIVGIHDVICHSYGPTNRFVSLHAEVNNKEDINSIHDVIDALEAAVREKFGCDITIHMDPVVVGDEKIEAMKQQVSDVLHAFDERITFHDFRVMIRNGKTSVEFDAVLPYDVMLSKEDIEKSLKEKFKDEDYSYSIMVDRPF